MKQSSQYPIFNTAVPTLPYSMQRTPPTPMIIHPFPYNTSIPSKEILIDQSSLYTPPISGSIYHILNRMRIKELRNYATSLKLSSVGLKVDLIRRIVNYFQEHPSPQFFAMPHMTPLNYTNPYAEIRTPPQSVIQPNRKSQCVCNMVNGEQPILKCTKCGSMQHRICVNNNAKITPYECPLCLISKLDPLVPMISTTPLLGPLAVPTFYNNQNFTVRDYEAVFVVTPKQFNFGNGKGIYIRCIRLDGKSNEHTWPLCGFIHINGKVIESFQIGKDPIPVKRKDYPRLLRREELVEGTNKILFKRMPTQQKLNEAQEKSLREDLQSIYVFSIIEAEVIEPEVLVRRIYTQNRPPIEESHQRFMRQLERQLGRSSDDCICEEKNIDLSCSDSYLPGTMMNIPVYGKYCKHLQVFDLKRFIDMNIRMKLWKCPHCFEKAIDLVVDTFFEQLLLTVKPLGLPQPKIQVIPNGDFIIGKEIIKYKDGKFLFAKEKTKENFHVKITLPKNIEENPCKIEGEQLGEKEQAVQLMPMSQLAYFGGIPSLSFNQISKRPRMEPYANPNAMITIPNIVSPSFLQAENVAQDKMPDFINSAPKSSKKETAGKFLVPQISFSNSKVKAAKERHKAGVAEYQEKLKEMSKEIKQRLNEAQKEVVVRYPEQGRDKDKLSERIKHWKFFNDYFSSMEDCIETKENPVENKRKQEDSMVVQRELIAKSHLLFSETTPSEPLTTPRKPNFVPLAPSSINPYQFFEYHSPSDSGIPLYSIGGPGPFFDPLQILYKQPYTIPEKLVGQAQGGKIMLAPCVCFPNNQINDN
jgi:hypothetical protein